MHYDQNRRVLNLANRTPFEKRQTAEKCCRSSKCPESGNPDSFMETLFGLLGGKRQTVVSFVLMKLDRRRRRFFKADLGACRDLKDESRCVKAYMAHLPAKDLNTLVAWVRRMLAEKIDAVAYPGESDPVRRLDKFIRTFGFDRAQVDDCMLFLLIA